MCCCNFVFLNNRILGDSLFADDEDDLFASPPKPVPTVAPRAKPRKPAVEVSLPIQYLLKCYFLIID
jgi:hypothetical protein